MGPIVYTFSPNWSHGPIMSLVDEILAQGTIVNSSRIVRMEQVCVDATTTMAVYAAASILLGVRSGRLAMNRKDSLVLVAQHPASLSALVVCSTLIALFHMAPGPFNPKMLTLIAIIVLLSALPSTDPSSPDLEFAQMSACSIAALASVVTTISTTHRCLPNSRDFLWRLGLVAGMLCTACMLVWHHINQRRQALKLLEEIDDSLTFDEGAPIEDDRPVSPSLRGAGIKKPSFRVAAAARQADDDVPASPSRRSKPVVDYTSSLTHEAGW